MDYEVGYQYYIWKELLKIDIMIPTIMILDPMLHVFVCS